MMKEEINESLFRISFNSLLEELLQKQLLTDKMEIDLIRKWEGKPQCISEHPELIKNCRKTVALLTHFMAEIKGCAAGVKIPELCCFFESMFRVLVYTIKLMSECYLRRFEHSLKAGPDPRNESVLQTRIHEQSSSGVPDFQLYRITTCMQDSQKLSQIDSVLAGLESRELELQHEMQALIGDLEGEREKIQKIDMG
jgi:hypothetical protein